MSLIDRAVDSINQVKAAGPGGLGIDYTCSEVVERLPKVKRAAVRHETVAPDQPICSFCGSPNITNWRFASWCRVCEKSTPVARSTLSYSQKHLEDQHIMTKNLWW